MINLSKLNSSEILKITITIQDGQNAFVLFCHHPPFRTTLSSDVSLPFVSIYIIAEVFELWQDKRQSAKLM